MFTGTISIEDVRQAIAAAEAEGLTYLGIEVQADPEAMPAVVVRIGPGKSDVMTTVKQV